jgi:hypothetical protein
MFEQLAKANAVPNKDIGSYKTIGQLRSVMKDKSVAGEGYKGKLEKLYQGVAETIQAGHGRWIYNNPQDPIKIFVPTDETGSVAIRKAYPDISWCTTYEDDMDAITEKFAEKMIEERIIEKKNSDENRWSRRRSRNPYDPEDYDGSYEDIAEQVWNEINDGDYTQDIAEYKENLHDYYLKQFGGEYYAILTPEGPFQFHFESGQFKDQEDEDVEFDELVNKYPTIRKKLGPIVSKIGHPHFHPDVKQMSSDDVIRAIMAAPDNINRVPVEYLTKQGWTTLLVGLIEKRYANDKDPGVYDIIKLIVEHMHRSGGFGADDIAYVFEKALKQIPYKLPASAFPDHVLIRLDKKLGKEKITRFDAAIENYYSNLY